MPRAHALERVPRLQLGLVWLEVAWCGRPPSPTHSWLHQETDGARKVSTLALIWILLEETLYSSGNPPQQSKEIWQEQCPAIMPKHHIEAPNVHTWRIPEVCMEDGF